MSDGNGGGHYHPAHIANRQLLPIRSRTARDCDRCGRATKAAAGRCRACSRKYGWLCSVCGVPTSTSRCPAHRVIHNCPCCGSETRGPCDACDACAVKLGWMVYAYRGETGLVAPGTLCANCTAPAEDMHHLSYDPVVTAALCRSCHRATHGGRPTGHSSRNRTDLAAGKRISQRRTRTARGLVADTDQTSEPPAAPGGD